MSAEPDRLAASLHEILNGTNPGTGNPAVRPYMVHPRGYQEDPGFLTSPGMMFATDWRLCTSWRIYTTAQYDAPPPVHLAGLDSAARYKVRVMHALRDKEQEIRLVANG